MCGQANRHAEVERLNDGKACRRHLRQVFEGDGSGLAFAHCVYREIEFSFVSLVTIAFDVLTLAPTEELKGTVIVKTGHGAFAEHFVIFLRQRFVAIGKIEKVAYRTIGKRNYNGDVIAVIKRPVRDGPRVETDDVLADDVSHPVEKVARFSDDSASVRGILCPVLSRQVASVHANVDNHRLAAARKETVDLDGWGRKSSIEAYHDKRCPSVIEFRLIYRLDGCEFFLVNCKRFLNEDRLPL